VKYAAFGTELWKDGEKIANLSSISGPSPTMDTIDVTTHDSPNGWEEILPSILRSGEVTFDIVYDPGEITHQSFMSALGSETECEFELRFPDVNYTSWIFDGFVTGFGLSAPVEDKLGASVTIKVTGSIDFLGSYSP